MMTQYNFLLALGAYLIGSIPTGYLIARLAGIADIRKHGSGNIGATNVARVLGIHGFFIVLCIDALKAYGYLQYVRSLVPDDNYLSAIAVLLLVGNVYSLFLGFRGGKGVATSVGIIVALMPGLFASMFAVWFLAYALTKTVGIASVAGCVAFPVLTWYQYGAMHVYVPLSILLAVSLLLTHRANIARFFETLSS